MTPQEFFDKTLDHLRKQGRPAKAIDGCKYRFPQLDGSILMCAVGCHLPDDAYHPDMEGASIASMLTGESSGLPEGLVQRVQELFEGIDLPLASAMQRLHDECATDEDGRFNLGRFEVRARRVATSHCLTYTAPAADA